MSNYFKKFIFIPSLIACSASLFSCDLVDSSKESLSSNSSISESKESSNSSRTPNSSSSEIKDFEGITFASASFEYDEQEHELLATNVPSFATVKYTNNKRTEIGSQTAKAEVSANGYNTKVYTATLTITKKTFKGITFKDQTIPYDGYSHSIYVEGAPEFASVKYKNNEKISVGTYTVTATITATNYETLTLSATMTIAKMMPTVNLKDKTLFYDGSYQYIHFEYPKNLPSYSTATFTLDGQTVSDKMGLKVKDIGTHTVSITLACEKYGYTPTTTTATISVIPQNIGRVDSSKNPLTITNSLKYQQLRSEILKGNFSLEVTTRDDFFYVYTDNSTEEKVTSVTNYYVSNNEMFSFYSMSDKESNSKGNCVLSETEWCHTKVVGDDVLIANYEEGILSTCCKYDSKYYHENIVGQIGIKAMSLLNEDADGGFTQGSEGGYTTSYGDYSIDEANNTFTMTSRNHYYHTGEWNHDEVVVYKLYNIGNTKIDMLDQFNVSGISYDKFEKTHFVHNGIEYFDSKAYVSFDVVDKTYLEKKAYVFSPDAGGTVVTEFADGYYDKYFSHDLTGIEMDVYFDSNGYYCGDYVSYGQIKNYTYLIADLVDLGGTIKYYGEW